MLMQINTVQWVNLDSRIRVKLVEIFDIPRSGHTEVEDNKIITDGFTNTDLTAITIEKMQGYLLDTTEEDYFKLFNSVLDVIKNQLSEEDRASEILKAELKPQTVQIRGEGVINPDGSVETTKVEIINTKEEIKSNEPEEQKTEQVKGTNRTRTKTGSVNSKNESKG